MPSTTSEASRNRLRRYRAVFGWAFLLSLPFLIALHAPMLPSETLPHRAYHAAEATLGGGFSVLVYTGFWTPAVSLLGFVVTAVIGRWR